MKIMRVYLRKRNKKKLPLVVETNLDYAIPYWEKQMQSNKHIYYTIED